MAPHAESEAGAAVDPWLLVSRAVGMPHAQATRPSQALADQQGQGSFSLLEPPRQQQAGTSPHFSPKRQRVTSPTQVPHHASCVPATALPLACATPPGLQPRRASESNSLALMHSHLDVEAWIAQPQAGQAGGKVPTERPVPLRRACSMDSTESMQSTESMEASPQARPSFRDISGAPDLASLADGSGEAQETPRASSNRSNSGTFLEAAEGKEVDALRPPRVPRSDIHKATRDGDGDAIAAILKEKPVEINAKHSATWNTPLHIASSTGHTATLELLLSWAQGSQRADLEARNLYGETPLHVAAKCGHADGLKLLLDAGASISAQASNGMSALHLAVWTSSKPASMECVRLLLERGADLDIKDRAGKTPAALVVAGNVELTQLLQSHVEQHKMAKARAECSGAGWKQALADLEAELQCIVGVPELKAQLRCWAKGMLLDQKRRALGQQVAPQRAPHMAFLGNPGTGKTTVARALARLLQRVGVLRESKVVEVQRTDLVGEYVGHSGPKTRKVIEMAAGGLLFVDEAYRLIPPYRSEEKDYGLEALEEIMAAMDTGDVVVIFAGYEAPMQRVLAANEGFRRRVTRFFRFEDLSPSEIAQLMLLKMGGSGAGSTGPPTTGLPALQGFKLHKECTEDALAKLIADETTPEQRQQHNGGIAVTSLLRARDSLDARLDLDCDDVETLCTMRLADVAAGLRCIS